MRTFIKSLSLAALFAVSSAACAVDDGTPDDMDMQSEASQDSQWMDWQHAELDPGIDREGDADEKSPPPGKPLDALDDRVQRFASGRDIGLAMKPPLETEGGMDEAAYCEDHIECESQLCDQRINRCYVPRF